MLVSRYGGEFFDITRSFASYPENIPGQFRILSRRALSRCLKPTVVSLFGRKDVGDGGLAGRVLAVGWRLRYNGVVHLKIVPSSECAAWCSSTERLFCLRLLL